MSTNNDSTGVPTSCLEVGDIFEHEGRLYRAYRYHPGVRTVAAMSFERSAIEIPVERYVKRYSPHLDWKVLTWRSPSSPLETLERPVRGMLVRLTPMVDWCAADPTRPTGPIFVNPALNLRYGEVLVGTHQSKEKCRIPIPRFLSTTTEVKQRNHMPDDPYRDVMPLENF